MVGNNPLTGASAPTTRRRVREDRELPTGDDYAARVTALLADRGVSG